MSDTASAPRGVVFRPDLLIIIALTGVLGFALGHEWKMAAPTEIEAAIPSEDWHGNVRRSTWPD